MDKYHTTDEPFYLKRRHFVNNLVGTYYLVPLGHNCALPESIDYLYDFLGLCLKPIAPKM